MQMNMQDMQKVLILTLTGRVSFILMWLLANINKSTNNKYFDKKDISNFAATKPFVD